MTAATQNAIEARGVRYEYGSGIVALDDVNFAARAGEFVAIVGSNGSGKTTLMKVLMRLLSPTRGAVLIDGRDAKGLKAGDLYRRVGMVFQNPADQLFAPTVEQDVAFGPRNLGLPEDQVQQRVTDSLEEIEANALRPRPIHHLSFGEQKRACLAGVLAMRPSILILDEPTAGLDPLGEGHMAELLVRLNRQHGITVILCTHSVDLLPVLADRIYVLCKGRVARQGTPHDIFSDHQGARSLGLRLPLVSQLFHELAARDGAKFNELPLTVEEARRQVLHWLTDGPGAWNGGSP